MLQNWERHVRMISHTKELSKNCMLGPEAVLLKEVDDGFIGRAGELELAVSPSIVLSVPTPIVGDSRISS